MMGLQRRRGENETAKNVYNERKVTGLVALILMEIQSFAFIKQRKKDQNKVLFLFRGLL